MRRQARISIAGALVVRTASALQVWLWLLIFVFQNEFRIGLSIQPGYLDFDNLPDTNFTCEGKVIGGYYADLETSCQMFHVCTVGQNDESMDIKFLCLNGTVFDQETRVCERVDEVDCTKSEKFYSLNLELYGSTAPPIIKPDQQKPQTTTTEKQQLKPATEENDSDPSIDDNTRRPTNKNEGISPDLPDTTEDPVQDVNYDSPQRTPLIQNGASQTEDHEEHVAVNLEQEEEDNESPEYEEYNKTPTTTTQTPTTTKPPSTTIASTTTPQPSPISISISSPNPTYSSLSPPPQTPSASSHVVPTLDPALLSPQEFIYQHRGPGSEAISFQRQSFRPDSVYITHAPPQQQQFDHFQYESSRTAPRPGATPPRPVAFAQRPAPTPFRATTLDPRDQLSRPGPSFQSSERHEMSVKHRHQMYLPPLPAQRPLPFDPYYYDRKRSDDLSEENESSLSARSVAPPNVTDRPQAKPKSPPRVIVTASASVSDSNGKRLNYTVGNVVSAVKPIVPINYDDYKESDLIFDPFFLDVPKLQKRRKTRSKINQKVFNAPDTVTIFYSKLEENIVKTTTSKVTSQATTTEGVSTTPTIITTHSWNPYDYVNDNYEPQTYNTPVPLAIMLSSERNKNKDQERQTISGLRKDKNYKKSKLGRTDGPNDYVDDNYEPQTYNTPVPLAIMLSSERNKNKDLERQTINGLRKDNNYKKSKLGRIEESKPVSPPLVQSTSSQYMAAVPSTSRTTLVPAEVSCNNSICRTHA